MDEDNVELTYNKRKKQRRIRCIATIVAFIVVFFIGFLIGYLAIKAKGSKERQEERGKHHEKAEFQKRQEEIMKHHKAFRSALKEEKFEDTLKYFSEKPHLAGSPRQKELANELEKRWKTEYGFDKVEKPEYKALLSFPDTENPTRITIKYKNGTIIHQIKGEEQDGGGKGIIQPFLGYSPSGFAEGELVYVNYGRVQDFELLKTNLSVNVTGKIAIMRYGKIFRGNKIANAARYGAIAALLFSDPADYARAGPDPKDTYPNTAWLPASGVQRGSLYTFPGSGDPQTPAIAALPGMWRRPQNESELPPIPAHPMGYGDAIYFLSKMGGAEAPPKWRGTLDVKYNLGPGFDGDITVSMNVSNYYEVKSIYNVIGTIYGSVEPDRFVLMGNHRDAWVYGAVDASTGTTVTSEIARGLGELKKAGWKPRRTIKICSWGGEEYSLIGSVEWVEQHEKLLSERAVIYMNLDTAVAGNYRMELHSSPLVKDTLREFSKTVESPNAHGDKKTIYDLTAERRPATPKTDPPKPEVGNLGSGSDFASFYQFIGVPAADFIYLGYNNTPVFYPTYHSQHDTFNYVKKFVDPEFKFHKASAQLCGGLLLQFADSPLLKMSVMLYADALNSSLSTLKESYGDDLKNHKVTLDLLEGAVKKFESAAKSFTEAKDKLEKKLKDFDEPSFAELRRFNDRMIKVERAFIYSYGLPERRLIRHVIFAPSKYNLYGSSSFPGVSDVLFTLKETGNNQEVDKQLSIATQSVLAAVDIISGPY